DVPSTVREEARESMATVLRAAARNRPSNGVSRHAEHEPDGRGGRGFEWQKRMCCQTGEQRSRRLVFVTRVCQRRRRTHRLHPELREEKWMPWQVQHWLQNLARKRAPMLNERGHQPLIRARIISK